MTVPSISAQKRNGQIVGYSVYLGTVGNERRVRRFFPKLKDAERFLATQTTTPVPVGELWDRKAELLHALERLRPLGTSLHDVITFYFTHHGSPHRTRAITALCEELNRSPIFFPGSRLRLHFSVATSAKQPQSGHLDGGYVRSEVKAKVAEPSWLCSQRQDAAATLKTALS